MSNVSFKPSEFDKQAAASLDMMDVEVAQERVQAILSKQAGPTLTPQPQTQPQSPAGLPSVAPRKKRSDAGVPKKAPADPDEIVLKLKLEDARRIPLLMGKSENLADKLMAWLIQDQIIAQLQRRLDQLQKAPK